jgi:hypothetical protein
MAGRKDGWWYPSPGLALPNLVYTISGVMQALQPPSIGDLNEKGI